MSALGDMIRRLGEAGATPEMIALAVEGAEAAAASSAPPPERGSARQARNRRYYERRLEGSDLCEERLNSDAERLNASDERLNASYSDASLSLPSEEKVSPRPPSKTQPSNPIPHPPIVPPLPEKPEASGSAVRKADIEAAWTLATHVSRQRSSRKDVERAFTAAVRRGHDPADILAGLAAYFASDAATKDDGAFAKGAHRLIENDRWQEFTTEPIPEHDGVGFVRPSDERQRLWARDFTEFPNGWREYERGPKPGKPGCRIKPEILEEFGLGNVVAIGRAAR